ncbi:MAG TPA: ABC transporter permease/substrate-binding protein [Xanthobacteraceae bacterium]|jgi:osmoprotectant transport system permease protein|nr:ABC transporter permease/substrate-binding protein [Xanthobacteraceae bacterium]
MNERFTSAAELLPDYLAQHVILCATALAIGVLIALPLAVLGARRPRIRFWILTIVGLIQTIPGLALLALFYPLLLGLSRISDALIGVDIPALGFLPSVAALALYAILPIVRNGIAGFVTIDPAVIEAADAVGMTPRQRLFRVEAPLAAPIIMAGVRTAAVWTIGAATLSTSVGQTSLGNYIFAGLQTENWVLVLFGCVASAGLAFIVDQLLGLIEHGIARRNHRLSLPGFLGLLAGVIVALAPLNPTSAKIYIVGAKNFSEQYILADLISGRLAATGATIHQRTNLGSAIAFRAVANSDIDTYVDYAGTLWANVLKRQDTLPADAVERELRDKLASDYGVLVLGTLGFENAYVFAMQRDRATALGIATVADLARHASAMTLGTDFEFLSRPEWTAIKNAYGFDFGAKRSFDPTFMYRALADGSVDVISAFSSDGRIAAQNLLVLRDEKHVLPPYDALILFSPKRAKDATLIGALTPLLGKISVEQMREANWMVDRNENKATPQQASDYLAKMIGVAGAQ